jgi:hypothetical protein
MAEEPPRSPRRDLWSLALVVLGLVLVVLWPGDVSWLMDEPRLIATAWHSNHDGQLASGGLYGNFGIRYGPLATQVYQALLLLTHDPVVLVVLHGLLVAGLSAWALLWLARSLEMPAWFAVGVLLSPHVVAYQRVLWDASLAMPVGALALAGFADFIRTGRAWSLRLTVFASVLVPTIHPQGLPLAVAILGWLGWKRRPALWQDRRALMVGGVVFLMFNGFYLVQFAGQVCARLGGSMAKGYPNGASHLASALAPFLGGRLLSGSDYLENLARLSAPAWCHGIAQGCALLFYPLAGLGFLVALRHTSRKIWSPMLAPLWVGSLTARDAVAAVVAVGLLLQALLFGVLRIPSAPQYFFGTFVLHIAAAMLAVDLLCRWKIGMVLGTLYVIGAASLTMEAAWSIHKHGFERPLWPTLASSVRVTCALNRFDDSTALTDIAVYQKSPQALRTLRLLLTPPTGSAVGKSGRLLITHDPQSPNKPGDTALTEIPNEAALPPGVQRIEVTPLSKDWVPDPATW